MCSPYLSHPHVANQWEDTLLNLSVIFLAFEPAPPASITYSAAVQLNASQLVFHTLKVNIVYNCCSCWLLHLQLFQLSLIHSQLVSHGTMFIHSQLFQLLLIHSQLFSDGTMFICHNKISGKVLLASSVLITVEEPWPPLF